MTDADPVPGSRWLIESVRVGPMLKKGSMMVSDLLLGVLVAVTAAVAGALEILNLKRLWRGDREEQRRPGRLILW